VVEPSRGENPPEAQPLSPPEQFTPRPPPPAPAYAPSPPPASNGPCLLDQWCFGPILTLGAINPLGVGVQFRGDYIGAGVDYQFMPSLSVSDTSARWSMLSVDARVFPFAGSFWVGLGFGYQSFRARRVEQTEYGRVEAEGTLGLPLIKLGLGFISRSGLTMGIDLGVGFPLGSSDLELAVTTDSDASEFEDEPEYQDALATVRSSVDDAADAAVKLIPFIPQFNFFRIGYQF
jgi:hypothetical protein